MPDSVATRERLFLLVGIAGVLALSWWYLFDMAAMMDAMPGMMSPVVWNTNYLVMMLLMWVVMMAAMMLPSVLPVVLLFLRVTQHSGANTRPLLRTWLFAGGYLLAWSGFSVLATGLQWSLHRLGLLTGEMAASSPLLGGGLLIAAGVYQWTAVKNACLEHCRGPVQFLTQRWRRTPLGALRMGVEHGVFCIGCCWVIMALLFVGGVMNLLWIGGLSVFVLIEKLAPAGQYTGRLLGAVAALAGLSIILWGDYTGFAFSLN
jgi:predicted metal-binding membrane protein